jgi:hypothetical protein
MSIFAAVRQREAGRITEACWRPMQYLCDECKRCDRARTNAGCEQEIRKVGWTAFGSCGECRVQAAQYHIGCANLVMRR